MFGSQPSHVRPHPRLSHKCLVSEVRQPRSLQFNISAVTVATDLLAIKCGDEPNTPLIQTNTKWDWSSTELTRSKQPRGARAFWRFEAGKYSVVAVFMACFCRISSSDGTSWRSRRPVAAAGRPRTQLLPISTSYRTYDSTMQKVVGCSPARQMYLPTEASVRLSQ